LQSSLIRQEGLGKTKNKLGQDSQWGFWEWNVVKHCVYKVEPGYNDIWSCDTTSIASDILWYQFLAVNHTPLL
jgi:hypothetical protein